MPLPTSPDELLHLGDVIPPGLINALQINLPSNYHAIRRLQHLVVADMDDALGLPQMRPIKAALAPLADTSSFDVTLLPGFVHWLSDDDALPGSRVLQHYIEEPITITVDGRPSGGLRRFDLLSAKIEPQSGPEPTRLNVTYTPGTPNSTPTDPTPPADEIVFARIRVGPENDFSGLSNIHDIDDLRTPCGFSQKIFDLRGAATDPGWSYLRSSLAVRWRGATGSPVLLAPLHVSGPHRRLSKLYVLQSATNPDAALKAITYDVLLPGGVVEYDIGGVLDDGRVDVLPHIGRPVWSNGYPSPLAEVHVTEVFPFPDGRFFTAPALELTADSSTHSLYSVSADIWG